MWIVEIYLSFPPFARSVGVSGEFSLPILLPLNNPHKKHMSTMLASNITLVLCKANIECILNTLRRLRFVDGAMWLIPLCQLCVSNLKTSIKSKLRIIIIQAELFVSVGDCWCRTHRLVTCERFSST